MSDIQYNLQFEKLCNLLQLGNIISQPETITGGLLHRMYAIETTQGKYAIKALNPQIMLRPVAMQHYLDSERIAGIASNNIPALPAKIFNGTFMHEIDNQFYLVFDWIEGKSLKLNEINMVHCKTIGSILADIHNIDFSHLDIKKDSLDNIQLTDWHFYLNKGQENNAEWVPLMLKTIDRLCDWNARSNESTKQLTSDMVISHRDLDPKNIMWSQDKPIIIDWESAGYVNSMHDLVETAIYWAENELGKIDKEKFLAFIDGYKKKYGLLDADWEMVLTKGFSNKLGWLEYSLKRSLWIECTDEKEQQMGTAQVTGTINAIIQYANTIPELEKWLNNQNNS